MTRECSDINRGHCFSIDSCGEARSSGSDAETWSIDTLLGSLARLCQAGVPQSRRSLVHVHHTLETDEGTVALKLDESHED